MLHQGRKGLRPLKPVAIGDTVPEDQQHSGGLGVGNGCGRPRRGGGQRHDRERGEWWSEFESATAGLHEWELVGDRAARRKFVDALAILYGYFVDWKVEPRIGQRTPAFLSAGMRSVISDAQTQAKQPETEPLSSKRSPFKDPFRALRALAELRNVLRRGVDPVNAH